MTWSKPEVTCAAKARSTGERCKRYPIPGGTVCYIHGGATKLARAAGRRKLAERELTRRMQKWELDAEHERAIREVAVSPWAADPRMRYAELYSSREVFALVREMRARAWELERKARTLRELEKLARERVAELTNADQPQNYEKGSPP